MGVSASAVEVAVHESVLGLYLPPVLLKVYIQVEASMSVAPPQTIISLPVHTALRPERATGASVLVMSDHVLLVAS